MIGAEIQRKALGRTRTGDDADARGGRRKAHQDIGRVVKLVERVHHDHGLVAQQRCHHRVVAGERAGVRERRGPRAVSSSRMHQHDRLAARSRLPRQRQEILRPPHLLHQQRDRLGRRIVEQKRQVILGAEVGLVAARDDVSDREPLAEESVADHRRQRPALRHHGDAGLAAGGLGGEDLEGQRHAAGVIGEAHAIRPDQAHAAGPRGFDQLALVFAAGVVHLGKARGEDHRRADLSPPAGCDRVDDAGLRHRQHRDVDILGQVVDRGDAGAALDLPPAAADQMDVAAVFPALQIAQHQPADRARLGGDADDGDRARPHQAFDRLQSFYRHRSQRPRLAGPKATVLQALNGTGPTTTISLCNLMGCLAYGWAERRKPTHRT